jgi:hypothetical protein
MLAETGVALHFLIFQYQNSLGGEGQLTPIRNALRNWKESLQLYSSNYSYIPPHSMVDSGDLRPENMWKRIGFFRHAPEFWLLASIILDRISAQNAFHLDFSVSGDRVCSKPADDKPLDPILNKYDQTSMQQVNDLIADFQNVQIR